ncbi:hypothetical protein BDP27DRAFT_1401984 [Rhodocollybia butyracea]|uniref:Uncharacterized protein n=1 Tax=Rhodocollybia butyracea TaxID=206335 RepID=A0A9P5PW21_9AGAR|nr:hypothetical protein BDP27DRAFT_1401984 [Rhodocollybia butyracea]
MFESMIKHKFSIFMCVAMIASLICLALGLMDRTIASCLPVSFLQFKSSSWLAATCFVLALVLAIHYPLARKAYEVTNQETIALLPHLACFLALIYIAYGCSGLGLLLEAGCAFLLALDITVHWFAYAKHYVLARKSEIGDQEMLLYYSWVSFDVFVDASEFYLPAIEAAVDLRYLTAAAREDHDKDVQMLRDKINEYRIFYYNNAVKNETFDKDSVGKFTALKATIGRSVTRLKTMNAVYPCTQQSDKAKLDRMFRKINEAYHRLRRRDIFYFHHRLPSPQLESHLAMLLESRPFSVDLHISIPSVNLDSALDEHLAILL